MQSCAAGSATRWGKAELDAYGRTYPFEYDRRHAVSAVLSFRASPKWEFASTTRWATGFPRTAALGVRVLGEERTGAGGTVIVPARDPDGRLIYEADFGGVSNLNNARMPYFARTDVRVSWKPRGARGRWEYYLEVINVLNRENADHGFAGTALRPDIGPAANRRRTLRGHRDVPDLGRALAVLREAARFWKTTLTASCTCRGSPTPARRKPSKLNSAGVLSGLMLFALLNVLNISIDRHDLDAAAVEAERTRQAPVEA